MEIAAVLSSLRRLAAAGWALAGLAAMLAGAGCATVAPRALVLPPTSAPLPQPVAPGGELAAAESAAAGDRRDFALIGAGGSMEPLYRSGTAIVVRETGFRSLRPGQAVVYRHPHGHYVAHVLIAPTAGGWLAAGLAAKEPDRVLVTRANFVGVIRAAFAATAPVGPAGWGPGARTAGGP